MNLRDFSFLGSLLLTFTAQAEVVDRVEAIVNKKAIYKSDVTTWKETIPLRAKVDPTFNAETLSKKIKPKDSEILDYLINDTIILDHFQVSDSEVEQEINNIQGNLHITRDALKAAIRKEGFKFEDYFKLMRSSIAKRQLIDREIRNKAAVSDDDIKADYYRAHSASKSFRGSFHLYLIKITKKNFKTSSLAKEQALKALEAIHKGESFEEVAKRESDDNTQNAGGDLGFLSYGDMSPVLQKAVQNLGPDKTSSIIEDSSSFMILKTGEIKSDNDSGLEKAKESIRARLMESEYKHQLDLWIERERGKVFIKINHAS
jgi:parvulin-like peptidyl-prolyl isomerase